LKVAKDAGSGTGLNTHPGKCASNPANNKNGLHQATLTSATELGPEVRATATRHAIAVWIARNNHPFSVVEQDGVSSFFFPFKRFTRTERSNGLHTFSLRTCSPDPSRPWDVDQRGS